ncbi:glycosyltransferase family 2 protein [Bacteroidales bacterium OttesenSCG-928-M06]|nr:glycosyltransferase family 2 protein [Bacteroidales bacterium OttesenSCG-928-M06]
MKRAAVVILNWNGRQLLEQFLPSVYKHTSLDDADVIVADNGSTDDSIAYLREYHPQVTIHILAENYGFAEGYNRVLADLQYEYVVLLNSDVEVGPDWLRLAIDYLDVHPEISALQPKILSHRNKDSFEYAGAGGGFLDKYGYPFCRGRILGTLEKDFGQYNDVVPILWASGACLVIRLQDYKGAGGLDAGFFAHQEEIDLCWRLNARGKKIVCYPPSYVYHVGGATLDKENPKKTYLNFRNNLLMLYKNLPKEIYTKVMVSRFFLDYLSAIHFILKGNFQNALAVYKGRRDFKKLKMRYEIIRENNLKESTVEMPETIYGKSIIRQYYLNKKRKYSQLK